MKTTHLMLALSVLAITAKAQPWNGQTTYDHNSTASILSAGTYVSADKGFVMAGYLPGNSSYNIIIDKTDVDGLFNAVPGIFHNGYKVLTGGTNCIPSQTQETNCYGISIIETFQGARQYAIAAAFNSGCVIALLDNSGNIMAKTMYLFPPNSSSITKPVITESTASPGNYYVCGSYINNSTRSLYSVKLNVTLAQMWSTQFDFGTGTSIQPNAIVEENYSGNTQLAIVGNTSISGTTGSQDGFFMQLDGSNGSFMACQTYDGGTGNDDEFNAIRPAAAVNGFIIGGLITNSTTGTAWMLLVNAGGDPFAAGCWSKQISPGNANSAGSIVDVAERYNGAYQYYGVCRSSVGILVEKLAANGSPYIPSDNNEFFFDDNSGSVSRPAAMSYFDDTTINPDDIGIHVFGTTSSSSPGDFYLIQSYFNGVSGTCSSSYQNPLVNINSDVSASPTIQGPTPNSPPGLNQCNQCSFMPNQINYTPVQPCPTYGQPGSPYTGNNVRTMQPTSIGRINADNANAVAVYPNPVSNTAQISYNVNDGGTVKIDLYNSLGQHIKTLDSGYKSGGNKTVELDLESLGVQSGVYLVNIKINGMSSQQKIIYNNN